MLLHLIPLSYRRPYMLQIKYHAELSPADHSQEFLGVGESIELARKDAERQLSEALAVLRIKTPNVVLMNFKRLEA